MEIKPSKTAPVMWFFEKGPFLTTLCIICFYLIIFYFDSLPYVERINSVWVYWVGIVSFMFLMAMLFLEYKNKKYYVLRSYIHVRNLFGIKRMRFDEVEDVKIHQSMSHKVFGLSDIVITGKKGTFVFEGVNNPQEIDKELRKKVFKH